MARESSRNHFGPSMEKLIRATLSQCTARQFLARARHWEVNKGPEWLATRLKCVWNCALLEKSGQHDQIRPLCLKNRIAVDSDGMPKGIEGELCRNWSRTRAPKRMRRAAVALRAYTALRLDETTRGQRTKAEGSITSTLPPTAHPGDVYYLPVCTPWVGQDASVRGFLRKELSLNKLTVLHGTSVYPSIARIPSKDKASNPFLSMAASLLTKGWVPEPLISVLGDFKLRGDAEWFQRKSGDMSQGRLSVIQEGGAKGRVVAMPNAWLQYYFEPYARGLQGLIHHIERGDFLHEGYQYGISCAQSQVAGVELALSRVRSGAFCAAVDLSSATDRFPLELQKRTCNLLGLPELAEAMDQVRGPWKGIPGSPIEEVWYEVGQPMGLIASFPLFHLTHFLLLNSLARDCRLEPGKPWFAVLGDDVLLCSPELREKYMWALEALGVPVSQHKCFEGSLVEFAGFLIAKSGDSATAFRPYKFDSEGDFTVMHVLHALGPAVRRWGPSWTRAYDDYVATRGLRDLALEPLLLSEDDAMCVSTGRPGSRWIGAQLNRAAYYLTSSSLSERDLARYEEVAITHWEAERFRLLKEGELLVDIGSPGVTDPSNFDPQSYVNTDQKLRRSGWSPGQILTRRFHQDPLIRERHPELHSKGPDRHWSRAHEMRLDY